jgi:hypothetical protein
MPDQEPQQPQPVAAAPTMVVGQLPSLVVPEGGRATPEAWELFCDKSDCFFNVNNVPVPKRRDWLLSCPGEYIMKTLKKLKSNRDEYLALTYKQCIDLLNSHIDPPKSK